MSGAPEATPPTAGREQFGATPTGVNSAAPPTNPAASQPQMEQQMQVSYAADGAAGYMQVGSSPQPYQTIPPGATIIHHVVDPNDQRRRRGRPRKYAPEGMMGFSPSPQQPIGVAVPLQQPQQPQAFTPPPPPPPMQTDTHPPADGSASPTVKKARGRPRGSRNKKQQKEASGSIGTGFIPYVLNVNAGEDVSSKIMAICQNGTKAVCVLSANGTISTVTLRQAATSGGTATYEGRFDILSLSGSFMLSEVGGQKSRTGGLSVALAAPDGGVIGGSVAGLLIAASPAQVIVGSFMPDVQKKAKAKMGSSSVPLNVNTSGASSSPSHSSESSDDGPPLNLTSGAFNNMPPQGMQSQSGMPWK